MKRFFKKRTSKFITYLFSGLGIVACDDDNEKAKGTQNESNTNKATKDVIKFENGKVMLDGESYDLSAMTQKFNNEFWNKLRSYEKNSPKIDGELTLVFVDDNKVKICGGEAFDFTKSFELFCCILEKFNQFSYVNIALKVEVDGVSLNGQKYTDDFFKGAFWRSIKQHPELFGISKEEDKFLVSAADGSENTKISKSLDTTNLKFSEVAEGGKLKDNWDKIFKLDA